MKKGVLGAWISIFLIASNTLTNQAEEFGSTLTVNKDLYIFPVETGEN